MNFFAMTRVSDPAQNRSRWRIHLILITGYILAAGLLGLGRSGTHTAALSRTVGGLILVCTRELLVFGLVFGLACFSSRASRDELLIRWRGSFQPVLWGVGYSVALRLALAFLLIAVGIGLVATRVMSLDSFKEFSSIHRPGVETIVDLAAMRNSPAYFWLTLTLVSFVVAGLREELWRSAFLAGMKALWPQRFGTRFGQVIAVVICAMVFGFGHLAMGWFAVCLAGLLGIGLGLIMIVHGSIWPAVIAHGMFDATTMAMLPWVMAHTTKLPS